MKKVLIAILAVVALTACSAENEINIPTPQGDEISFGTVDTRADANLSTLKADGFGVWAYITNYTVQNHLLMENQLVEYDEDKDEWFYSPVKYWLYDTKFSFIGVYPRAKFSTDNENHGVTLTVSETPSAVDYLIATNETDTNDEYNSVVSMQFRHVLTSVGLKIWRDQGKHTNDQMRIKKVTLGNIRKSGVYSSATDTWKYNNDKLTHEVVNNTLSETDNIGAATLQDNGTLVTGGTPAEPFGTMMLLPQALDDSNVVSLKIVYELKRQNAADWEEAELETVLPSITWNAGQRYTYNVVLSSVTDITVYYIQTKVDPWGTPQVGGTVIIK